MKRIRIFALSLIILLAVAVKAEASNQMSAQGFVCDFSDPDGATAQFQNYKKQLQLFLSLVENSYDQVGAIFGKVTAIPNTLAFDITPVTPIADDVITVVVYYKYNNVLYSSNYLDPKVVQNGSTYTYTYSASKANPAIPKGSIYQASYMLFYQAAPNAASAYFNNFYINGALVGNKILKDASCPY